VDVRSHRETGKGEASVVLASVNIQNILSAYPIAHYSLYGSGKSSALYSEYGAILDASSALTPSHTVT
jgi:hypothetical protein